MGLETALRYFSIFHFPHKVHHLRPHWLTSNFCNMDRLHRRAFLCNHLTQMGLICIKICAILLWLGLNNIDHCLQLSAFDASKEVSDFGVIDHSTVAIVCEAHHDGILFFVECDVLVPIPPFYLTVIVRGLQLSFCFCNVPDHVVGAKKLLVDVK